MVHNWDHDLNTALNVIHKLAIENLTVFFETLPPAFVKRPPPPLNYVTHIHQPLPPPIMECYATH